MRFKLASVLFGSMLCAGCALVEDSAHNVVVAMRTPIAEHRESARNRRWAEAAWDSVCSAGPGAYTKDHVEGFKDGFAEYLFRGGDGESSLVAPLHYRQIKYQSPEGYAAIQDWFSGYRHGASAARASGARQWITGPSALQPDSPQALAAEFQSPPSIPQNFEIQRAESNPPKAERRGTGPSVLPPDPPRALTAESHSPLPIPQTFEIQRAELSPPKAERRVTGPSVLPPDPPRATAESHSPLPIPQKFESQRAKLSPPKIERGAPGPSALPPDPPRLPPPLLQNFETQRSEPGAPKTDIRVALRRPVATATTIGPRVRIGAISDSSSHAIPARVAIIRVTSQPN